MTRSYSRSLFGVVALFALLFAGCENAQDISSVEAPRNALVDTYRLLDPGTADPTSVTTTVTAQVKSSESATLTHGKYSLFIPAGSVRKPTTFRMTVTTGAINQVELKAVENNGRAVSQFPNGLRLTLPYDFANVSDPSSLVVAHVVPTSSGSFQIVETVSASEDVANQTITGTIYHFSLYRIAKEIIIGID